MIFIRMDTNKSKEELKREKKKLWYQTNKERILTDTKATRQKYLEENRENAKEYQRKLREAKGIKPRVKLTEDIKLQRNQLLQREYNRLYQKNRYDNNPLYKLKTNIKNLIGNSIRRHNFKKLSRTEQILGCTYYELKLHLECQFQPWMNWNNKGLYNGQPEYGWDIDHITPISTATCETDIIRLNHYTNLRPLCSYQNRVVKRDFI